MTFRPVARNSNLLIQKLDGEIVVFDLKTNHALYLNETSAIIWNLCDGKKDVSDIRKILREDFNTRVSDDFILFSIYQLRKDELLSKDDEIDRYLKKFWGRRAIRKIGQKGNWMVLPNITSVTAPTAIAASCLAVPPVLGAQKTA